MNSDIFENQNGFASYIISIEIPVEKWIRTCTDDPVTIHMVKLLALDMLAIRGSRTFGVHGGESSSSLKKRTGVTFNNEFLIEKVFRGPAALRLGADIRRKYAREYIRFQHEIVGEAILRSEIHLTNLKRKSQERGVFSWTAHQHVEDEVVDTFLELVDESYLDSQIVHRPSFSFGYRPEINEGYFIINSITNAVRFEYVLIKQRSSHPIIRAVCDEILGLN